MIDWPPSSVPVARQHLMVGYKAEHSTYIASQGAKKKRGTGKGPTVPFRDTPTITQGPDEALSPKDSNGTTQGIIPLRH